jgi:sugar-specific transcriptional regulator TrmB
MDDVLDGLGLNAKEAAMFRLLLETPGLTASQIAKKTGESRTNTYMILDSLSESQLVEIDESQPVKRYHSASPRQLQRLLQTRQQELRHLQLGLRSVLPQLESTYNLGQHKPGVVYLEGLDGFRSFLGDMAKAKDTTAWLWASSKSYRGTDMRPILDRGIQKRRARGIKTNAIYPLQGREWGVKESEGAHNFEVRFWGDEPTLGEIVLYDNKVAFTVYEPALVVTIVTNDILAATFGALFRQIWQSASKE